MKSNNVIEKIKDVLNLNEEVKLEQAKLDNGTVIEADAFESGNEVFIVTEDEKLLCLLASTHWKMVKY